ncbi:MAG: hypothetical protein KH186_00235 [Lachnospiraceae bacterium]|nr:hypothetical protein [Lachnospiraceae bacterium]
MLLVKVIELNSHKIKNAGKGKLIEKLRRKIRKIWVTKLRNTRVYKYCYVSYWHLLWVSSNEHANKDNLYFAARPNPGAGIGHQIANWIAGYWFAKQFGIHFAHIPFFSDRWEEFLGFYQGERLLSELEHNGYKTVRIQKFDENNHREWGRIEHIISSYAGKKIVFLAEQDQFYHDQFGVMEEMKEKFYSASARRKDQLIFDKEAYNIALHVRRGDIMENFEKADSNVAMRYQGNDYFLQALKTAIECLKDKKNVQIYLFSQGKKTDFSEFNGIDNLHLCLDMSAQDSFLHMVYADALITSKSSFSYKPALLNRGIKFCPSGFWHGYPQTSDWVLLDEEGNLAK